MPKVSIIVPNYNYARFLPLRMSSIFQQTFSDYEIILLDDCSTDGSKEYLQRLQSHPKVSHVILNKENSGNPFIQWNKGIAIAKGEYIWIAESDDYCKEQLLEEAVKILDNNPQVVYTHCGSILVDENGQDLEKNHDSWKLGEDNGKTYIYSSKEYLTSYMFYHNDTYNASMTVFRKEKCAQLNMDFSMMRYCGDWLFWIKMAEQGDVAILHKRLNYFRRHRKSVTAQVEKKEQQLMEELEIFKYLWNKHLFGTFNNWFSKGFVYKTITRTNMSKERKKEVLAQMKSYGVHKKYFYFERFIKTVSQIF